VYSDVSEEVGVKRKPALTLRRRGLTLNPSNCDSSATSDPQFNQSAVQLQKPIFGQAVYLRHQHRTCNTKSKL